MDFRNTSPETYMKGKKRALKNKSVFLRSFLLMQLASFYYLKHRKSRNNMLQCLLNTLKCGKEEYRCQVLMLQM